MELVRGPQKRRNFTILDNPVINDDRLPFRALGVLTFLLSKPEGWRVDATLLSLGEGREGRDAIRSALTALETNGYLVRTRCQTSGGKWITQTVIHENPQVEPKTENQASVEARVTLITPGLTQTPCGRRPCRRRASYQSACTTVPLCSVTTVALAIHAGISEDISGQFIDSCQCLAIPAGDS